MKRVLVLSSADTEYTTAANQHFVSEIQARLKDARLETYNYKDIAITIESGRIDAMLLPGNEPLDQYDLVYFKSFYRHSEVAASLAIYLTQQNVPYICHELDEAISFSKLTQYARLSQQELPIIPTVYVDVTQWHTAAEIIERKLGYPCVIKAIDGKGGDANFLVQDLAELLDAVADCEGQFVAQAMVPNDYDLRVLVAGGEVKLIIKRQRHDDSTHLNNTSKGANASLVPLEQADPAMIDLSLRAASLFKREVAGVDVIVNKVTGDIAILEVNASPQVATGAFKEEKLDAYAELFQKLLGY